MGARRIQDTASSHFTPPLQSTECYHCASRLLLPTPHCEYFSSARRTTVHSNIVRSVNNTFDSSMGKKFFLRNRENFQLDTVS